MGKRPAQVVFFVCITLLLSTTRAATVSWQSSTSGAPWVDKGTLQTTNWDNDQTSYISVDENTTYQEYDGHGGCFNEMGWDALTRVSQKDRDSVMKMLFDSISGCNFNLCRMPLGMSDYTIRPTYTLDETSGDYAMDKFSLERDRKYLIPYVKAAMAVRPSLKVWGSPWTPPLWMKTSDGAIKQDAQTFTAYALYFAKAVKAYQQEGLRYFAVAPQNEPMWASFSGAEWLCKWTGEQLTDFIKNYLGPRFRTDDINGQIWLGTINCDNTCEISTYKRIPPIVFADTVATSYCTGLGIQYTPYSATWCRTNYPDKHIMETETPCGGDLSGKTLAPNDWSYAEGNDDNMRDYYTRGANSYMQWNIVLDREGRSIGNWSQNAMVSIDTVLKKVTYNPQFYQVRHYSFIKAGAYRIATSGNFTSVVAFRNVDGENVLIVTNKGNSNATVAINFNGQKIKPTIPAHSFNTFRIAGKPIPPLSPLTSPVEAEKYSLQSGTYIKPCSEGGSGVSYIHNNDWVAYNNVDFANGANGFQARVAGTVGGSIEIYLDSCSGTPVGTCAVAATGGTTTWKTVSGAVNGVKGKHSLYLKFKGAGNGNLFDLNWFQFSNVDGIQVAGAVKGLSVNLITTAFDGKNARALRLNFSRPDLHGNLNISLFNLNGHQVTTLFKGQLSSSSLVVPLDREVIRSGTYLMRVSLDKKNALTKTVILQ